MINSILENRIRMDDYYELRLVIPEGEYFNIYTDITSEAAAQILKTYLLYKVDDGQPKDIRIDYDKPKHVIQIVSKLYYIGNEHSDNFNIPDVLNVTRTNTHKK